MTKINAAWKGAILLVATLGTLSASPALAQSDDPGLLRALQTDSAPIENTFYLETSFDNNFSNRHWVYFYGEGLFALAKDWGLEVDFPNLYTNYPLGEYPLVVQPVGIFGRYEFYHFGGWNDETAGAFSVEAGLLYGLHNPNAPWIGSSWSVEAMGGYRMGRFFLQGDYTYQGAIDPQVVNQLELNHALGYRLTTEWYVQAEADFTATDGPLGGTSLTFIPQIAFQPGEWLFEFGESFSNSPSAFTDLMVARAF